MRLKLISFSITYKKYVLFSLQKHCVNIFSDCQDEAFFFSFNDCKKVLNRIVP